MDYYSFPFIKLCKIFQDESKCEDFGVSKKDWESVKIQFNEDNPSAETDTLLEAWKVAMKASVDLNRNISLITFLTNYNDDWKELFELAGIKYTGDRKTDAEYLSVQLQKLETKEQIFSARLKKTEEEMEKSRKENPPEPFNVKKAYKALAVLEQQGASIPDYEKFTCGQYDAFSEIIKEGNGRRNNNWR